MDSIPGIQQAGASRKCFRCDSSGVSQARSKSNLSEVGSLQNWLALQNWVLLVTLMPQPQKAHTGVCKPDARNGLGHSRTGSKMSEKMDHCTVSRHQLLLSETGTD